jgi:hypothetical protein
VPDVRERNVTDADRQALVEHLDEALDAMLAARIVAGLTEVPVAFVALDRALARDDLTVAKRKEFGAAIKVLLAAVPEHKQAVLNAEAAGNALVAAAAEVGWNTRDRLKAPRP